MKKSVIILGVALLSISGSLYAAEKVNEATINVELVGPKVSEFCLAIVKGDLKKVEKFIEMGTDVNKKSNGMTPAMYAARYNRCDILKVLIKHGANLKTRSSSGHNALKYAEISGAIEAVQVIKESLNKKV